MASVTAFDTIFLRFNGAVAAQYANQVIGARTSSARSLSKGSSPPSRTTSSRRHSADDVVVGFSSLVGRCHFSRSTSARDTDTDTWHTPLYDDYGLWTAEYDTFRSTFVRARNECVSCELRTVGMEVVTPEPGHLSCGDCPPHAK